MVDRALASIVVLAALFYGIQARAQSCADPLNPCAITTIQQLDDIGVDPSMPLSGDYQLGNNIDGTGFNFDPVGTVTDPFTGALNGNNYSINNLTINSSASDVGLIGDLGSSGSVQNLNVEDIRVNDITPTTGTTYLGGIAGYNSGMIAGSSVAGSLTASNTNFLEMGGLVGENSGTISSSSASVSITASNGSNNNAQYTTGGLVGYNSGQISQSYSTGDISADVIGDIGGLAGYNRGSGTITRSFSSANLITTGGAGGLVGWNNGGSIAQSYATGSISASQGAGGLVELDDLDGIVSQSYASGPVSGSETGGLIDRIGYGGARTFNSYWDTQTTGESTSAGGTGLTTAQLQSGIVPTGFDSSVWSATAGQYPTLIGVGGQSAHDQFVNNFNSLVADFNSPAPLPNQNELDLTIANSTWAYGQQAGTPYSDTSILLDSAETLSFYQELIAPNALILKTGASEIVDAFVSAVSAAAFVGADFVPLFCVNSCNLFIIDEKSVTASSYELFSYDFSLPVDANLIDDFNIGDQYLLNASILGNFGGLPAFSLFNVTGIDGNTVKFDVENISEVPPATPVPEPSSGLVLIGPLVGLIMLAHRRRLIPRYFTSQ